MLVTMLCLGDAKQCSRSLWNLDHGTLIMGMVVTSKDWAMAGAKQRQKQNTS